MSIRNRLLAALLSGAGLLGGLVTPAFADTDAQKLATAKAMIEAWNTLQWDKVYELFAEDGALKSMMVEPVVGRAAIKARIGGMAKGVERIELKVSHIGVIDGVVFVERVDDFVYNGKAGQVPVVGVMVIDQGKIKEWREYYDRAQLLDAMGIDEKGFKATH